VEQHPEPGDIAASVLARLSAPAGTMVCPDCLMPSLEIELWDLLKAVRALITSGRILCSYDRCSICGKQDLVAKLRRRPFSRVE